MFVLALDTATHDLVTGLVDLTEGTVTDRVLHNCKGHNEHLVPTLQTLAGTAGTTLSDVGAVVVGHGPGPFTGLRVGMATAQAVAQAAGVSVYGVCTLDAIARRYRAEESASGRVLVATDARRREVYWAVYDEKGRIEGPSVSKPDTLSAEGIDAVVIPERLAEKLPDALRTLPRVELTPRARYLVECADLNEPAEPLEPAYLRRPDAVEPPPLPRSKALPQVSP